MPATLSKDEATLSKEEAAAERKKQFTFKVLYLCAFLHNVSLCTTFTVRNVFLTKIVGEDLTLVGRTTANWLAAGSALQLLLNPYMAKFADSCGRKPALIFGSVLSLVVRLLAVKKQTYTTLALEKIVPQAISYYSNWAICNAMIADLTKSTQELAVGFGKFMSWIGIAAIVAPLMSSQVIALTGKPIYGYRLAAAFNVALIVVYLTTLEETLTEENRKPFSIAGTNPFAFIRLFSKSAAIKKFASLYGVMQFQQGTQIMDINLAFMANDCNFSQQLQNYSITMYGATMMIAGQLVKRSVAAFGELGHTSASLAISSVGFALWSIPKTWTHFLGVFVQGLGYERLSTCLAAGIRHCSNEGMGKAEASAAFTNLRGFTAILYPLFYARLYAYARGKGFPGAPFAFAACVTVVAEAMNRNLGSQAYKVSDRAQ